MIYHFIIFYDLIAAVFYYDLGMECLFKKNSIDWNLLDENLEGVIGFFITERERWTYFSFSFEDHCFVKRISFSLPAIEWSFWADGMEIIWIMYQFGVEYEEIIIKICLKSVRDSTMAALIWASIQVFYSLYTWIFRWCVCINFTFMSL